MKLLMLFLTILFLSIIQTGCVSVNLGNEKIAKSKSVDYKSPGKPFESIDIKNADKAWKNPETGTTLSYLSICNDPADPTLASLRDSTIAGIEELKTLSEEVVSFNGRQAIKTSATGQLDGVKILIKLLIFKKNNCNYTISLVGVQDKAEKDLEKFDIFTNGFSAP